MAKKNNTLIWILGLGGIAYAGYKLYQDYKSKQTPDTPEVPDEPNVDPGTKKTPSTPKSPGKPSATDIATLQNLMIQWYRGSKINNVTYTEAEARGGWGNLSRSALQTLFPKIYASNGDISSTNIAMYIKLMRDNLEKRAKEENELKTKQASTDQLKKLSANLVKLNASGRSLKTLVPFTAIKHKYDPARNIYLSLGDSKNFSKGQTIRKVKDRLNGQIMIVDPFNDAFLYPTNPNNLYVD